MGKEEGLFAYGSPDFLHSRVAVVAHFVGGA
jgi:hypothetical protein